jgi:hypothetical protein
MRHNLLAINITVVVYAILFASPHLGHAVDSQSVMVKNPRKEFRNLGWKVHDDPGDEKWRKRQYQYKIEKGFNDKLGNLKDIFSSAELHIISQLIDGNAENDELKFIFVTADNYLTFSITTPDKSIGRKGIYLALKRLSKLQADRVRRLSSHDG